MTFDPLRLIPGGRATESVRVVVLSPDELRAVVEHAVRGAVAEALETRSAGSTAEWLDSRAVAELLGVCTRTVAHLAKRRELPSSRVGRLLRFRRADVDAFVVARRAG